MTEVEISCINKNPRQNIYEPITHVGGIHNGERFKISLNKAIEHTESKKFSFYVKDNSNNKIDVILIEDRNGNKHLRTVADTRSSNNLLHLQECKI